MFLSIESNKPENLMQAHQYLRRCMYREITTERIQIEMTDIIKDEQIEESRRNKKKKQHQMNEQSENMAKNVCRMK